MQGIAPTEEAGTTLRKAMLARGVCWPFAKPLQTLPLKIPRAGFEWMMANALLGSAQLHGEKFSGNPAVQEFLSKQAKAARNRKE